MSKNIKKQGYLQFLKKNIKERIKTNSLPVSDNKEIIKNDTTLFKDVLFDNDSMISGNSSILPIANEKASLKGLINSFVKETKIKNQTNKNVEVNQQKLLTPSEPQFKKDKKSFLEVLINSVINETNSNKENFQDQGTVLFKLKPNNSFSKEKLEFLREKFKITKNKIISKTKRDFEELKELIMNGEVLKVIAWMHDPVFKKFYKLDLKKNELTNFMIKFRQPKMLELVLEDQFYQYNRNIIFDYFQMFFKEHHVSSDDLLIVNDIISFNFYNHEHTLIIAFLLGFIGDLESFKIIITKDSFKSTEFSKNNENVEPEKLILEIIGSTEIYYEVMRDCLNHDLEDIAIYIFNSYMIFDNENLLNFAIYRNYLKFLKNIWELNYFKRKGKTQNTNKISNLNRTYEVTMKIKSENLSFLNNEYNNANLPFEISYIVRKFAENKNSESIRNILGWAGIETDKKLISVLFEKKCFDEIGTLLQKNNNSHHWKITQEQFRIVIEHEELELILFLIRKKECRGVVQDHKIQLAIVEKFIKMGSKMYYAAEMLSYINKHQWDNTLTGPLCKAIKKNVNHRELLNCHSPILTIVLLIEFLKKISEISIINLSKCDLIESLLLNLAKQIQLNNQDENYIKNLMTQKDSRGRNSFEIAADNSLFELLETEEIGTLVGKMWNGKISHNSILSSSSIYQSLENTNKNIDPFENFPRIDKEKVYFFQIDVWTDSCSMRFLPESIVSILTVILYTSYITNIVHKNLEPYPLNVLITQDIHTAYLLIVYNFFMISFVINALNQLIFLYVSGRKVRIYTWHITDLVNMIFSLLLFIDIYRILGVDYNDLNHNNSDYSHPGKIAYLLRVGLLCLNNILVWLKVVRIFMTFKEFGTFLKMVYEMSFLVAKYIILYILWVICWAGIFTVLFFNYNPNFREFSFSVFTLIGGFIQNFNLKNFSRFLIFGEILFGFYVALSGILMINLLISILSVIYDSLSEKVDASHRIVLINYYKIYKWDKNYGFLIFLAPPLNLLNFIILPLSYCFKDSKTQFNDFVKKAYFSLYFTVIISFYTLLTLLMIPIAYLKSLINVINDQFNLKVNFIFKIYLTSKWFFLGIPYLFYIFFRDRYDLMSIIFKNISKLGKIKSRVKNFIKPEDLYILMDFIYHRKYNDSKDIHDIFLDYLVFEQNSKIEKDRNFQEKSKYLRQRNATKSLYSSLYFNEEESHSKSGLKKNMIILGILENFLITDIYSEQKNIDMDRIKNIVTKTMNINYQYIKRLLFVDINALNKAFNKIKKLEDTILRFQLINKIQIKAIKLDKELDEIVHKTFSKIGANNSFDQDEDFFLLDEFFDKIKNDLYSNKEKRQSEIKKQENSK